MVVTVGWLLKCYWNPDSPLFNPVEVQLTQDQTSAIITMMHGSGHGQKQYPPSEPSGLQAPETMSHYRGSFTSLQNTDYGHGGGDGGPQQHLHTLGLNCFVHPCRGVCQFGPLFDSRSAAEFHLAEPYATIHTPEARAEVSVAQLGATPEQNSCPHLANRQCPGCLGTSDTVEAKHSEEESIFGILIDTSDGNGVASDLIDYTTDAIGLLNDDELMLRGLLSTVNDFEFITESLSLLDQSQTHLSRKDTLQALPVPENIIFGAKKCQQELLDDQANIHSEQPTYDEKVVGEDRQTQPRRKISKNAKALSNKKRADHSSQQICDVMVVEGGHQRPCGTVYKNALTLSDHKRRKHSGPQTCDVTVIGKDGQRSCGKICKNALALSVHKSKYHCEQKICGETVVGDDGLQQLCGKVCRNTQVLADHKRRDHTGPQTCQVVKVGEDGQQRPCGKVFSNAITLCYHRRKSHGKQRICVKAVVGEGGQQRPCGKIFKNDQALSNHKMWYHTGQQACDEAVVGEDGQQRPCGRVCKNAKALSNHKRQHQKRKPVDVHQNNDLSL
ncbi:hypothetical protein [Endozoicomonas sp. SESOKO3]|uniref:hypothetical protein n=1 Tax=Endozoicomonas sp. SESOKO3 TaxID=2828744 RepID=UPI0021495A4F|nr:hypothetical protein [Endozoicomonas sp. SESOKO3]